jgi:CubicO group peptidase (beta-lactamase class C family)
MRFITAFLFVFCAFASSATRAQDAVKPPFHDSTALPQGHIGERITAWIAAVNSDDPAEIAKFFKANTSASFQAENPLEDFQQDTRTAFATTTGLKFYGIRSYVQARPGMVVVLQDNVYGAWHGLIVEFEDNDARLISKLAYANVARAPAEDTTAAIRADQLTEKVQALVRHGCDKKVFSGTLIIAKDGKVLTQAVCGEASKRYHVANNIDTKFNLGSMNKMFTSVAAAQLVEAGKLSYDDKISKYLDTTWLPADITDKVTLRQLLTHTSGLGSYFNETFMKSSRGLYKELDDYKPLIKDEKLAFTPGERFSYSNTGMFLVGVIIEKVSGENYFDYIKKHIYAPANMTNTDCYFLDDPVENLAMGYMNTPGSLYNFKENTFEHVLRGGPAGGGYSTAPDLLHFAAALQAGKLIKSETLQLLWTDYIKAGYGYGFEVRTTPAGKVVGHSGGFSGINSELGIYLDHGYTVAIMSNYDDGASSLQFKIGQLIGAIAK